jgi:hypothetical protein
MRLAFLLVPSAIAASCGGTIAGGPDGGSDSGSDVSAACSTSADCPNGGDCAYSITGGCNAKKQCFPPKQQCKGSLLCACDGTDAFDDCNGAAQKPIRHTGVCLGDCSAGLACEVCDVTSFSVSPQAKPLGGTHACSAQDISSFVAACVSVSATQTTCSAWQQADAGVSGCGACILTPVTSAMWGPILCQANNCTTNTGGCIDVVSGQVAIENGTNASCGDLTNAANECSDYACGACTTPPDNTTCANDTRQAECKSYFDAANNASVCAHLDAGSNNCSPQSDADWASFINVFCGTGP